jgi:glycosyltransferase involved in cell wall biosynthesis
MPTARPSILWLHADKFGCGTYRCFTPALTLEELGFDNNFVLHENIPAYGGIDKATPSIDAKSLLGKATDLSSAVTSVNLGPRAPSDVYDWLEGIDILVLQRAVGYVFLEAMQECKRRGIVTVFESDDDLFNIHRSNPSAPYWHLPKVQKILRAQLKLADHIICSTPPLKTTIVNAINCPASKVTVCYNHIVPELWGAHVTSEDVQTRYRNVRTTEKGDEPYTVIGWQGSNTHNLDFKEALPALTRLVAERDDVILRFFGNVPLTIRGHIPETRFQFAKGVDFEFYPSQLAYMNFDIGIAPVTDTKFNQAKSNLKWLEYSSIGVPTVASAVFPYAQSIDQGITGIVARTDEDWYQALSTLLDNPEERRAMGMRAKAHVWQHWGKTRAQVWADTFVALLRQQHGEQLLPEFARLPRDVPYAPGIATGTPA